jgi:branched-chain amino acid transport system substrate-binding protein
VPHDHKARTETPEQIAPSSPLTHAAATLAASALTLGLPACDGSEDSSSDTSDRVRIGLEAPLSGDLQAAGEGMLNGARLAADEINARGGLEGKDIEIVPIDDGGDPEIGVPAAQKAIDEGLSGVVGPWNSGVGIETLPLYESAGLVPIRLTAGNDTAGFGFTVQPMSSQIAPVTADALSKWIGAQTVAIGFDPTQTYSNEMSRAVRSRLESAGVEVSAFEPVEPGAEDYSNAVKKLAAGKPDAIYYAVYFPEGALIAKATPSWGSSPACLLDYASFDTGYVEDAGAPDARNCEVVGLPAPDDFKGSTTHVSDYEARFGEAPEAISPYAYDSVNVLAYGVEQAGGFHADALTAALNEVSGLMGWTGPITLEQGTGNRVPATVTVDEVDERGVLSVDPSWAKAVGAPY